MNVVLVGNGGREHALAWRIAKSPSLTRLVATAPNPGFDGIAEVIPAEGPDAIAALAVKIGAGLVVVGPEAPLAAGVSDALARVGIPCFGPMAGAAKIEASKSFAKDVIIAAGVPTARSMVVEFAHEASVRAAEVRCDLGNVVVKADGLAAGKGVWVCPDGASARNALTAARVYGPQALLEDLLVGPEVSLFALCDGTRAVVLPALQDHKRLRDGDEGPNTGGMGAYAPCPLIDPQLAQALCDRIHAPVLAELDRRGTPFRGLLYAGLMLTAEGPKVLEFNARFGDPETQPLMMLWEDDILPWLLGAAIGELPVGQPRFASGSACCVVLAAAGYPETPERGVMLPLGEGGDDAMVFYAGVQRTAAGLVTAGGRVLGVTARGVDIREARDRAYALAKTWEFAGAQWRSDIAAAAL